MPSSRKEAKLTVIRDWDDSVESLPEVTERVLEDGPSGAGRKYEVIVLQSLPAILAVDI